MKSGWEVVELASVCDVFTDGNWIETKDQADKGIRLVQTGNVGSGFFKDRGDKARYIDEATFQRLKCFEIVAGDCLISRLPDPVGRACLIPETGDKMITAVDCSILRMTESRIDPNFFIYFSQTKEYLGDVEALCSGTTRSRISRKNLGAVQIPLPPLDEQKRIVEVLDAAFDGLARARAHTETNLQNARELFETTLEQTFASGREAWPSRRVSDLGSVQTGSTPKTNEKANFGNFLPFVKPADFNQNGSLVYSDDGVSEQGAKQSRLLRSGSVLMVCIGATIGKVGFSTRDCVTNQQVNALTPKAGVDCKFIYYQMRAQDFQDRVIHASGQATLPIINKSKWSALQLFIPQILDEQQAIVEQLDALLVQVEHLQSHYRAKLADLDDLRQALLQKAFAGQLC